MSFVAAFTNRKVKGSRPTQIPTSTFARAMKIAGVEDKPVAYEKSNLYNGKFYGTYCLIAGGGIEIPEHKFTPSEVASACRVPKGDFVYVEAGRQETDSPRTQYMDLMVASVGIPVYTTAIRHVTWFSTSRAAMEEVCATVAVVQPYSLYSCTARDHFPVHSLASGKKIALQFSGGIGAAVAAAKLKAEGYNPELLYFLEGNPDRARNVQLLAQSLGLRLDMHKKPDPLNSLIEDNQKILEDLPDVLTRLGIAAVWGCKAGCHYIATGDISETAQAVRVTSELLTVCAPRLYHLEYLGPLSGKSKPEVLRMAEKYSVNIVKTRSCLQHPVHCGWCDKCKEWEAAFTEIGQVDPRGLL